MPENPTCPGCNYRTKAGETPGTFECDYEPCAYYGEERTAIEIENTVEDYYVRKAEL